MLSIGFLVIGLILISIVVIGHRFMPDKRLGPIPALGLIPTLKLMTQDVPYDEGAKLMAPVLQQQKVMKMLSFGNWAVMVTHPESIKAILNDPVTFPKALLTEVIPNSLFAKYMGRSLAFSNGGHWKMQRRVVSPPFHRAFDPKLFYYLAQRMFKAMGTTVDVHEYTQKLTLDALGSAILGMEFDTLSGSQSKFIDAYKRVTNQYLDYLYLALPNLDSPQNPFRVSGHDDLIYIKQFITELIQRRRKEIQLQSKHQHPKSNQQQPHDILSLMIQSTLSSGVEFSDENLLENLLMFLVAGHDTTSFALSAAIYLLSQHPEIQQDAYDEITKVLGPDNSTPPTIHQTKKLPLIDAIIYETMRLYPPSAILALRIATKDTTINGFDIPAGTGIIPDIMGMHSDPEYWPSPTKFQPGRFMNSSRNPPGPWLPFSGGERMCLGHGFSLLEQRVVLTSIITQYHLRPSLTRPSKFTLMSGLLLRPRQFHVDFLPRQQKEPFLKI